MDAPHPWPISPERFVARLSSPIARAVGRLSKALDRRGYLRRAFVDPDYKSRMEPEQILEALAGL